MGLDSPGDNRHQIGPNTGDRIFHLNACVAHADIGRHSIKWITLPCELRPPVVFTLLCDADHHRVWPGADPVLELMLCAITALVRSDSSKTVCFKQSFILIYLDITIVSTCGIVLKHTNMNNWPWTSLFVCGLIGVKLRLIGALHAACFNVQWCTKCAVMKAFFAVMNRGWRGGKVQKSWKIALFAVDD